MPAEVTDNPFTVSEGLPTAPGQYVVRYRGALVRDDQQLPLLFPTSAAAQAEADAMRKAETDGL